MVYVFSAQHNLKTVVPAPLVFKLVVCEPRMVFWVRGQPCHTMRMIQLVSRCRFSATTSSDLNISFPHIGPFWMRKHYLSGVDVPMNHVSLNSSAVLPT